MEAFLGGAWRSVTGAEVTIGGAPRRITRAERYADGQWKTVLAFTSTLTVTATDADGFSYNTTLVNAFSGATPSGGLPPYSYNWVVTSGPTLTIYDGNTANPTFAAHVTYFTYQVNTVRVTCTDALGATATADINVSLYSEK